MKTMKPKKMAVKNMVAKKEGKMAKMEKMSKNKSPIMPSGFASHVAMMSKK